MFGLFKKPNRITIDVLGAADYHRIPSGFFLCQSRTGKRSLGHRSAIGLCWDTARPPEMTDEQLAELPRVRLRPFVGQPGVLRFAGGSLLDSTVLDSYSGEVEWGGN